MTIKVEVHNAAIGVTTVEYSDDDHGRVPDNLARLTNTIIMLHLANDSLGWISDMVHEADTRGVLTTRSEELVGDLQAMLADSDCPVQVREMLVKHNLLP